MIDWQRVYEDLVTRDRATTRTYQVLAWSIGAGGLVGCLTLLIGLGWAVLPSVLFLGLLTVLLALGFGWNAQHQQSGDPVVVQGQVLEKTSAMNAARLGQRSFVYHAQVMVFEAFGIQADGTPVPYPGLEGAWEVRLPERIFNRVQPLDTVALVCWITADGTLIARARLEDILSRLNAQQPAPTEHEGTQ